LKKPILLNIAVTMSASLLLVGAVYAFNLWLWSTLKAHGSFYAPRISIHDALFIEGIVIILFGFLFFLGRGGINRVTLAAARIAAAAKAIFGEAPSTSEIYERDVWKPKGFPLGALAMMMAGVILLLLYILW